MAIVINGSGTVTGLAVGGLPDGTVDDGTLASNAVTEAKIATDAVTAAKIATNSVDSAELIDGAVDDSHMASIKGRKNILINGDFSVSQRGDYTSATTATHLQYYLDRFYISRDGVTGTIQDTGFAAKLVATSSATGTLRLVQPIEDMAWLSGKTVTLSCQMKSNDSNSRLGIYADAWQSTTAAHTGGGAWETLSMTLTLPSGITSELSAHFGIDGASSANVSISSGAYCEVKDLQLELGSTATDFEHRSFGEELALCQRYYEKSFNQGTAIGASTMTGAIYTGVNDGSNTTGYLGGTHSFRVSKRAAPTLTVYDTAGNSGKCLRDNFGTNNSTNQDCSIGNSSESMFLVYSSGTHSASTLVYHFTADAEL